MVCSKDVLGAVWTKKKSGLWLLKGCLDSVKTVYGCFMACLWLVLWAEL